MSEAQQIRDLAQAVAEAFVKNLSYSEQVPQASNLQVQLMNAVCGTYSDTDCEDCVFAYDSNIKTKDYYCPNGNCRGNSKISSIINKQCKPICKCEFDANQNNTVFLKTNSSIQQGNTDKIIEDTRQIIKKKYPDFIPSTSSIEEILKQNTNALITQIVATTQVVSFEGLGNFKKINLSNTTNAVLSAIAKNSTPLLRKTVDSYIDILKPAIEAKIKRTLGQILSSFLVAWVILAVIIVSFTILNSILWIKKIKHSRNNFQILN